MVTLLSSLFLLATLGALEIDAPKDTNEIAPLESPVGLALGRLETLYVVDQGSHRVLGMDPRRGMFLVAGTGAEGYAGDEGPATSARFNAPTDIALDPLGNLYVADMGNHVIRRIDTHGIVTTVVGTGTQGAAGDGGPPGDAALDQPMGLTFDDRGDLYIADHGNHRIRRVDFREDRITTVAGTGAAQLPRNGYTGREEPLLGPCALVANGPFLWVLLKEGNSLYRLRLGGEIRQIIGPQSNAKLQEEGSDQVELRLPQGLAIGPDRRVYVADTGNGRVLRLDAVTGSVEIAAADLSSPRGLAAAGPIGPMAVVEAGVAKVTQIGEPLEAGIHVARATMFRGRENLDLRQPAKLRDYESFNPPPTLPLGIVWPAGSWTEWYRQPTFPQHIIYPGFQSWPASRLSQPWQLPPGYPTISSGQPFNYQPYYRFQFKPSIGSYAHPGR